MATWLLWTTVGVAAAAGLIGGHVLVARGLRDLTLPATKARLLVGRVTVAAAGGIAVLATRHAGSWWLLPALLLWAYTLAAAATCDAFTQRIPTALVRQGTFGVAVLVVLASAVDSHWRWAELAAIAAAAAGAIMWCCWRLAGAGFGDVRLAVLGGVGLAAPTHRGLALGIGAFVIVTLAQAITVLARGGTRRTLFPYGPAIAVAFAIIATT